MTPTPVVVVLDPSGLDVARRVAAALPDARIHALARRVTEADYLFEDVASHLRALFADGVPLVGICAAGILIRALAPVLQDKKAEPPVIAVSNDGGAVVPLLGGHRGANDMARAVAAVLDVAPAVTTAGDVRFGAALDTPPPGWVLANPEDVKPFVAAMLAGESVRIDGDAPFLADAGIVSDPDGALRISASVYALHGDSRHLVYHPKSLAMGIGCERGVTRGELRNVVNRAFAGAGVSEASVAGIFSLDLKSDEAALHALADALGVPVRFFDAATLEAETPRLTTPSEYVYRTVGCHGVAEGAALAAAGPDSELVVRKTKVARATCAVALAPAPLDAAALGRPRGWLGIVGIGPGDAAWLTPEAAGMLASAEDVVGYSLYLELVAGRIADKRRHPYGLGEEAERVRRALDLAASGRRVALVSSGDPGIYAMASLAFELIDREDRADWRRVDIHVAPGISAFQAAAARIGAPMGHDFCAISLSDLMTPWQAIEKRLVAAARGDFVVAIYNPASKRRDWQLARAREILLDARPGGTPVVLARELGRPGETIHTTTLADLDPASVDMMTVVIVGSSSTRALPRSDGGVWIYTPRGYDAKEDGEA